ncbi:MAG: hypothetical protein HON47_00215 [Candidatus Diapherotrites archaeon]|jgi:hypothetical protein|uniref:Uncharacterized protein n=1 Tax=Candidatus Iainarchaeum sp. TaxID=3101447 RepID=A0A8T5GD82_9ARCH|nr:hypothetical protein [Candidatus Diapherotrites archaeon]MBT7241542.1 hypothetical protein [Candidatus Diapherotrites archaeon]
MPCSSLVKKRGNKRYTLSVSCPTCYAGIEKKVFKEGNGKVAGCMKWALPKVGPKGRSTPIQRAQYYGWHLILEANLKHNNVPQKTITILNKVFYKTRKPSRYQYKALVESFSKQSKRPKLLVRTLLSQMIKDTATVKKYSKEAGFSPRAQKLFALHCDEFTRQIKELQKFE